MRGDRITLDQHYLDMGARIVDVLAPMLPAAPGRAAIAIAGESGSGKSTMAAAVAHGFDSLGIASLILQQDDYYVLPPKSNDAMRRTDSAWFGPREVRLELLDQHLQDFLDGASSLTKPLVLYEEDRIETETLITAKTHVMIAEGSYVTALQNAQFRIFIERTYQETRDARQHRARYAAELDRFTENILKLEHQIIAEQKSRADILVTNDDTIKRILNVQSERC